MEELYQDLIQRGSEAMASQQYDAALEQFQRALTLDPRTIDAYLHVGNAYMNLDQTGKAIDTFRRALLIDENSIEALYSMACAYFISNDPANAIRFFNRVEERGGATVDMYVIESALFVDAEDFNMAIRSLNRALKIEPLNAGLMLNKAEVYVVMGRINDAVATLHDLQELLPDEIEGYTTEAQLLIDDDQNEAALAALDRAQQRFPHDEGVRVLRSRALNSQGRYQEALEESECILVQEGLSDELREDASLQQSIAYAGLGKFEQAAAVLEASAKVSNAAESYYMLMNEALVLKEYQKVLQSAEAILQLEEVPARITAAAYFNKAFATEKLSGIDAAREAYQEAAVVLRRTTIREPGLYDVYAYRIIAHQALGEYETALELADYLISLDKSSAPSYALKSDVLRAQGNAAEANKCKAKAMKLDPNFQFGV